MSRQTTAAMLAALPWHRVRVVWPFLTLVAAMLLLGSASLDVIWGMRALANAENARSKALAYAVGDLEQYAQTRNEHPYRRFLAEIAAVNALRDARIALEQSRPEVALAKQRLRDAGTPRDDADALVDLYRRFRGVGFMTTTATLWDEADAQAGELAAIGETLQATAPAAKGAGTSLQPAFARMRALERKVATVNDAIAATMREGSRQTSALLMLINIAVGVALLLIALVVTHRLIRNREDAENNLRISEERFEYAVLASNDGIWDWSLRSEHLFLSARFETLLGFEPGKMRETPASFLRRIHPRERHAVARALRTHLRSGNRFDLEFRIRMQDDSYRWFRTRGCSVLDVDGKPRRMAGSLTDVTDRKHAEAQIFEEKERAQVTLASIADAVITVDTSGCIEFLNPVAERLTGWRNEDAYKCPVTKVFSVMDESTGLEVPDPVARALRDGCVVEPDGNVVLRRKSDAPVAIDHSVAPIRDRMGAVIGAVLVFHDMSRERQYATRLAHLASHDPLTGLLNRREFERRLSMALVDGAQLGTNHAVLYLDLDQFKVVNDTCGHAAGDELLRQIALLLRPRLREGDTLARLGGDEFGVLLEHCAAGPALQIAQTLRTAVADFRFVWKDRSFNVGVSVGVVNVSDASQTLAAVLSAADAACYMAKDNGRNRVQVYRPDSNEVALRHGEMEWVNRLHRALGEHRFCLFAQPVHGTRGDNQTPPYTELLLRLRDENNQLIPPAEFLPAAERYNLMPDIDRWVITTAFGMLAQQLESADGEGIGENVAINLSGASIGEDGFLEFVRAQFLQFRIPYSQICFEITETTAISSLSKAMDFMTSLQAHGCRFALDDFGVGVSSFTYLKNLPVDFLKIDGSFVTDMLQNPVNYAMVEAIHRIGHIMGKKTIAESVESPSILDALRTIGVDYAQGFAIAQPAIFGQFRRPSPLRRIAAA
jgi:diguanylate cyclase (GGDEF)-like protein/PAS domain S-box-containing protein